MYFINLITLHYISIQKGNLLLTLAVREGVVVPVVTQKMRTPPSHLGQGGVVMPVVTEYRMRSPPSCICSEGEGGGCGCHPEQGEKPPLTIGVREGWWCL
jgi:hypothetical protein